MAKITRVLQKIFGSNSGPTEMGQIGSLADGSPNLSSDPSTIQALSNYLGGWPACVLGNNSPAMEERNALDFLITRQLAYLFQSGVPEYDATTTYYIGSICQSAGVMYRSIVNDNTGQSLADTAKWLPAIVNDSVLDGTLAKAKLITAVQNSLVPAGVVSPYAGTSAPSGYLLCNGTSYLRADYPDLFSAIGTAFGAADGTHFNVPDMQGTFIRGLIAIANVTGSGSASSNNATFTAHGYKRTGMKVQLASGTLSGLSASTDYFVIVIDANTLAFSTTRANAIAGTKIAISGANSAVIKQWVDPDASTREAHTIGANSGATVGSFQEDALRAHTHSVFAGAGNWTAGAGAEGGSHSTAGTNTSTSGSTGGNETRPSSIAMNYIIKT